MWRVLSFSGTQDPPPPRVLHKAVAVAGTSHAIFISHLTFQVFVWVGKDAQEEEKTEALTSGEDPRPLGAGEVSLVVCGAET